MPELIPFHDLDSPKLSTRREDGAVLRPMTVLSSWRIFTGCGGRGSGLVWWSTGWDDLVVHWSGRFGGPLTGEDLVVH